MQKLLDVLESQLRRVLAAPVLQRRPDRAGLFEARDFVAAIAAIPRDGATPEVSQPGGIVQFSLGEFDFVGLDGSRLQPLGIGLRVTVRLQDLFHGLGRQNLEQVQSSQRGDRPIESHFDFVLASVAMNLQLHLLARLRRRDARVDLSRGIDLGPVPLEDHVIELQAGLVDDQALPLAADLVRELADAGGSGSRPVGQHRRDPHTPLLRQAQATRRLGRELAIEVGPQDDWQRSLVPRFRTLRQQPGCDVGGRVNRLVLEGVGLEVQVRHLGASTVPAGLPNPRVQPLSRRNLLMGVRQVGAHVLLDAGELFVRVAAEAAPLGEELLATLGVRGVAVGPLVERDFLRLGKQVLDHSRDLDRLEVVTLHVLLVVQVEKQRHPGVGPEFFGIGDPLFRPAARGLHREVAQTGAHLAELASPGGGIGGNALRFFRGLGLKPHVGANRLAGVVPIDLMAAEAAILTDQLVALVQLGGGRPERGVLSQFDHIVVALQTGRFHHPLGPHRVFPVVVVEVAILLFPLGGLSGGIGGVRSVLEAGPRPAATVAGGAAKFLQGVGAGRTQVELGLGVRGERVRITDRRAIGMDHRLLAREIILGVVDRDPLGIVREGGNVPRVDPIDVHVAGGAAIEAGDVGHAAVVDREVGQPDLVDL